MKHPTLKGGGEDDKFVILYNSMASPNFRRWSNYSSSKEGKDSLELLLLREGEMNLMMEKEFNDWIRKFKIDKIPLTKNEFKRIKKGFSELYEKLRVKGLGYKR